MSDLDDVGTDGTRWHLSLIPVFMAIGPSGLLATLVALSLGASVADIGVIAAAGGGATIVLSLVWGKLSDFSSKKENYLLIFFTVLSPLFLALSMVNTVPLLIIMYTALASIISGIAPIAIMYTVDCCKSKNWQKGVARYNSITSVGNISGLLMYTVVAQIFETRWLFYISSAMCVFAAILLWRTKQKHDVPSKSPLREPSNENRLFPSMPIGHYLNITRLKIPRNLKELGQLQLLFLASIVHWTGVSLLGVGQIPLMRALGLSDSLILAVNTASGAAQAVTFVKIAPRITSNLKQLVNRIVVARGILTLCWAGFPLLFLYQLPFTFALFLMISVIWSVLYAILWLSITNFAIAQAPKDHGGSVQGKLLSATGIANALGSAVGGLAITAYGYSVGFVLASIIMTLAYPIISKVDLTKPS